MLLDVLADLVAIFVGHDDVGDHDGGALLLDHRERGCGVVARDHVDVLATERDLDDLAHRRRVIDEIDSGCGALRHVAHCGPPSASSRSSSSTSRSASSISSVAERSTVRVAAVAPGTNLETPVSL